MSGPRLLGPRRASADASPVAGRRARTLAAVGIGLLALVRTTTADPPVADPSIDGSDASATPAPPTDEDVAPPSPGWIPSHQAPDGRWPAASFDRFVRGRPSTFEDAPSRGRARNDVLTTAFALRALAAAGHSPASSNVVGRTAAAGVAALRGAQRADGSFADPHETLGATNHAVAVYVLASLLDAWGDPRDAAALERAVAFYLASRTAGVASWRDELGPSAVTPIGWIAAARGVSRAAHRRAWAAWRLLDAVPEEVADGRARRPRLDLEPSLARDEAEVLGWLHAPTGMWTHGRAGLALWLHGIAAPVTTWKDGAEVRTAGAWLDAHPPRWDPSGQGVDAAGWYLATLGAFEVGGDVWDRWQRAVKPAVVDTQRRDGTHCTMKGSWDPVGDFADEGGRVFATTTMALVLTVWFRYDRVFDDEGPVLRGAARRPDLAPPTEDAPRPPRLAPCD